MLRNALLYCAVLHLILINFVTSEFSNLFVFEMDQCKDICSDSFFLLPSGKDSQAICQKGCRFFNIIDIKDERNINETNKDCHLSCAESYIDEKAKVSCIVGCDTMFKKKRSDLHRYIPYLEQYNMDNQDFDSLEADVPLDPLIRKQVQMGYNIQYKIPATYIRTMPISDNDIKTFANQVAYKRHRTNLICSNIIPLIIFILILTAFILCIVKIFQLLHAIKDRKMQERQSALIKACQEEGCSNTDCTHVSICDMPEINSTDDKKFLI